MKRTPLAALHEARGARWMSYQGCEIPAVYSRLEDEYQALQEGAGLVDLSYRGRMLITGRDRRTWLHGQVTQDVKNLPDWRGAYATVLTPQGRMVRDLRIFALPDALLIDYPDCSMESLAEYLDRFLIMERAEIEEISESWTQISVQGPKAPCAVAAVFGEEPTNLGMWEICEQTFCDEAIYLARTSCCGEDGFDLFAPAHLGAQLWGILSMHRGEFAVHSAGWEALNVRRVEAGIPWWGEELGPKVGPLEARLEHAIHFQKGCYVGQEIIARLHARGQVNNLLAGFLVHGEALPERGAPIEFEGKKVGEVSTALYSLGLRRPIAMGYLRREHLEPGKRLQTASASGNIELKVTTLPFVPHGYPASES